MAYVTSTNLCYHDNMHVECSLFVHDFADIYSTDCSNLQSTVQITIYFLPRKRSLRFQHVGGDGCVILGYMGQFKYPPPLIDLYFNRLIF